MKTARREIESVHTLAPPIQERDAAFRAHYERHKTEVFGFLICLLRDEALAEDALQEAFLRAYRALDQYDPERSFRSWLFQIARNVALDAIRLERKHEKLREATARR